MEEQVVDATTLVNFDERSFNEIFFDQKTVNERFFDEKFSTNSPFDEKFFDIRQIVLSTKNHSTNGTRPALINEMRSIRFM